MLKQQQSGGGGERAEEMEDEFSKEVEGWGVGAKEGR